MRNRGTVTFWVLMTILAGIVVFVLLMPWRTCPPITASSRLGQCLNNIRWIGIAVLQYAGDHDDNCPASLGLILKDGYLTTPRPLYCPSWNDPRPFFPTDLKHANLAELDNLSKSSTYLFMPWRPGERPATWFLVCDKDGAHDGNGRNVFYSDGVARWLNEGEFLVAFQKQQAALRGMKPPEVRFSQPAFVPEDYRSMSLTDRVARVVFVLVAGAGIFGVMIYQRRVGVVLDWRHGLAVIIYVGAIGCWMWLSSAVSARESRELVRENRVRLVGFALMRYSWDHGGGYPNSLADLVRLGYISRGEVLKSDNGSDRFVFDKRQPAGSILYERSPEGRPYCYFTDGRVGRLSPSELLRTP